MRRAVLFACALVSGACTSTKPPGGGVLGVPVPVEEPDPDKETSWVGYIVINPPAVVQERTGLDDGPTLDGVDDVPPPWDVELTWFSNLHDATFPKKECKRQQVNYGDKLPGAAERFTFSFVGTSSYGSVIVRARSISDPTKSFVRGVLVRRPGSH